MNIEDFLSRGSETGSGKGLHERKSDRNTQAKLIAADVVKCAVDQGIEAASEKYLISEAAVSKYLARAIKKDDTICAELFMSPERISDIESFIRAGNTTSIKRMILAAGDRYTETEIRIVKANIEYKGADSWEF